MSKRITTEEFIRQAKEVHGDKYDYSQSKYFDALTDVRIICPKHGIFWATKSNHVGRKSGCAYCSGVKAIPEKLTQSRLKELTKYNQLTGEFERYANDKVNEYTSNGYRKISIDNKSYLQHRLAYFYMTGEWPEVVDHIDHDRANNSWSNLRGVSYTENNRNKSGNETVGINKMSNGKYRARMMLDYKEIHIGVFDTENEAILALQEARKGIFNDNHGTN